MKKFDHTDPRVEALPGQLREINVEGSYYLIVAAGRNSRAMRAFSGQLEKRFLSRVRIVDLNDIIIRDETKSRRNIDRVFDAAGEEKLLIFRNGDRLCGSYSVFSLSRVRYATPPERYLLMRMNRCERFVLLELEDPSNIDRTLERHAHLLIRFDAPDSFFARLRWKSTRAGVHGHKLSEERIAPDA